MKYRAEIDGLRALAVLPVILFHAGFEWFSGGFVGVDVFFVISGYLITSILIEDIENNRFSIVHFYERRARRILPALFFVLAACLPFAWFWLTPTDLKDFGASLVAVSFFSSNILFWLESGYFSTAAELKPLLHTWSLAVEEQYYILFPIFLMLTWRLGVKWILILLSIAFFISLGVAQWGAYNRPNAAFFLLPTRGWELLVGVFVAFYLQHKTYLKSNSANQILSLLGFGMIVYSIIAFDETTPFPSLYALIPTIGTGLLILCAVPKTFIHKFLSLKFIVGIGLISYSAYLWHQPLLAFTRHRLLGEVSDLILIILCVASLVMAWFSWRFVEKPFRNKQTFLQKHIFLLSLVGIICFGAIGLLLHANKGFTDRIQTDLDYNTIMASPLRSSCQGKLNPCEYFGEKVEWATFGDSHLFELTYALAEHLRARNIGVQQNTYSGCSPSITDTTARCHQWRKDAIDRIVTDKKIKNVLVSYRMTQHLDKKNFLENESLDEERALIWTDFVTILETFITNNKNVYYVVQPPELPFHIEVIAFWRSKGHSSNQIIGATRQWWDQRNGYVNDRLLLLPEKVKVIDLTETFCDEDYCYGSDSKGYYYFDDDHVSIYGAKLIVEDGVFEKEVK
ncbi:acyltransferase [Gammaproteobacteria bacterium]|nr:acyltransferase [Gammaproteobacteria bacterium]